MVGAAQPRVEAAALAEAVAAAAAGVADLPD